MTTRNDLATDIFRGSDYGEKRIGYIDNAGVIFRLRWDRGAPVGRVDEQQRIFRLTAHDERELGHIASNGAIHSLGLFEGGPIGWLEEDGAVMQGGLIFGEEEVGRVAGPQAPGAAAALLLLFLPDEAEADRRAAR